MPTITFLTANVAGEVFLCFIMFCFFYACTVIIVDCIKATINAIQWLIDDMGNAFKAFLFIIFMIFYSPIFLVYDTTCRIYDMVYDFFIIEENHLKIISVYMTVLQIITCPLWNITGFLIKKMMTNAAAYDASAAADGSSGRSSGSGSIPDLTPANSPPSSPERRPRRSASASASEYPTPHDEWFNRDEFHTRQQQKQSKDDRRNAYNNEVEPTSPPVVVHVVVDDLCDIDKFVANHLEKKSNERNFRQQPQPQPPQPEVAAPAPAPSAPAPSAPAPTTVPAQESAPTAPAQEPAPVPRVRRARIMKRRTFVNPITGITVKLSSTKRSQRWWMTNEENDNDDYNEMDQSRGSRVKMCTDEEYFKEIAEIAFPTEEFLKKIHPFNNNDTTPPPSVPCHQEQQQDAASYKKCEAETIIVETVEDGDYAYMSPPKNIDEAQKQIDLFDNFQDKDAIWNYIDTAWEDDNL